MSIFFSFEKQPQKKFKFCGRLKKQFKNDASIASFLSTFLKYLPSDANLYGKKKTDDTR